MKKYGKILIPVALLAVAGGVSAILMATKKKPEINPTPPKPTLVQAIKVQPQDQTFRVHTQGTVEPLRETVIIPEVSGRITDLAPTFRAGGFFEEGDLLIEIDPANYQAAVAQAEFVLAQARLSLEQERARGKQARKEWQSLSGGEPPPPLAVREPQLKAEEANVAWSDQALAKAKLDLERTKIRAPYAGMVREKSTDLGQFVSPGTKLGMIFAIDSAEVRLPLSSDELAYLDLPLAYRNQQDIEPSPVILSTRIAGQTHEWDARIVRSEGAIDPVNRMLYVVARIDDPYGRDAAGARPPLQMGQFVDAEIRGHNVKDVFVLPRQVLRGAGRVLVVDEETNELRSRTVDVLKTDPENVVIGSGLESGELVCTTALEFVVEGMNVALYADDRPGTAMPTEANRIAEAEEAAPREGSPL